MYYLIQDPETSCYVFTEEDPRQDGFTGPVQEGVELEFTREDPGAAGVTAPAPCLGVSQTDGRRYRVFPYRSDCRRAGYNALSERYAVHATWAEYQAELRGGA
jgi:hypothetical protein